MDGKFVFIVQPEDRRDQKVQLFDTQAPEFRGVIVQQFVTPAELADPQWQEDNPELWLFIRQQSTGLLGTGVWRIGKKPSNQSRDRMGVWWYSRGQP